MTIQNRIPEEDWLLVRKLCKPFGVDPLLIVAIGLAETAWFTKGDGLKGNGLGVGSYDSGSTYKYAGVAGQVTRACQMLQARKVFTIVDIAEGKLHATGKWVDGKYVGAAGSVKWASADTADRNFQWSRNVIKIYSKLVAFLVQ